MSSALPTVLGSPSQSVPIQPPVGLRLFMSLTESLPTFQGLPKTVRHTLNNDCGPSHAPDPRIAVRPQAVPKDVCTSFGQYATPILTSETPTSCLAKSKIVAQLPWATSIPMCSWLVWLFERDAVSCQRSHLCWLGIAKLGDTCPHSLHDIVAVAAARSMPRAACKPFPSKNLNNVVKSVPPFKPAPNSCLEAFSHSSPRSRLGKLVRIPNRQFPHLLP